MKPSESAPSFPRSLYGPLLLGLLALPVSVSCLAQAMAMVSSGSLPSAGIYGGQLVREIDDARNGDRWLLVVDPEHSAGPGRWILLHGPTAFSSTFAARESRDTPAAPIAVAAAAADPIVIHTGDRIVVAEDTSISESRLEAVAMGPAVRGTSFNARLAIGGKTLQVMALAPGHARFGAPPEAQVAEAQ